MKWGELILCIVRSVLRLARAILYMNSADIIKSVLKSSVGPKMAENTLQRHENDNQNGVQNKVQCQSSSILTVVSTVSVNVFTNITRRASKRNSSKKYLSTYNVLPLLFPNIHLVVFWTLCQCTFTAASSPIVSAPVISSVNYVGYVKTEHIESTGIGDDGSKYFDPPKTTDILLQVKGINIKNSDSWKATQNEKICDDNTNMVFKTKRVSVMSLEDHDEETIDVLLTVPTVRSKTYNTWFLCIQDRTDDAKIANGENSGISWLHLGPASKFRLPIIGEGLKANSYSNINLGLKLYDQLEMDVERASLSTENSREINGTLLKAFYDLIV